jgi:hypothetical protein
MRLKPRCFDRHERLVEEKDLRLFDEGAEKRHALLSARQLARPPVEKLFDTAAAPQPAADMGEAREVERLRLARGRPTTSRFRRRWPGRRAF